MNEMHDQYIHRDIIAKVCSLKIRPSTMGYQILNVSSIKVFKNCVKNILAERWLYVFVVVISKETLYCNTLFIT